MAKKARGKVKAKAKRTPVKAGSTPRPHGGFPTTAVIKLTAKVKKSNG